MRSFSVFCLLSLVQWCLCTDSLIVQTNAGFVQGFMYEGIRTFLGIPFAAPPLNSLRWKPPQPVTPWEGILNATQFSPGCVQYKDSMVTSVSEDCLFLNVYAPPEAQNVPVMVWIYGGSFTSGIADIYHGTHLSKTGNVVTVTLNYRVGPFGFLSLPELYSEDSTTGFYGIQDQRAALFWVQQNIAAFGGDPSQVTIFGESAGAISVCLHVTSKLSKGLFHAAIMESGFCNIWNQTKGYNQGSQFSQALGCSSSDLDCLRSKTTMEIFEALPAAEWFPIVDGFELTQQPEKYLKSGDFNQVNLLLGTNQNEGGLWYCPKSVNMTVKQYYDLVYKSYGSDVGALVLEMYPVTNYSSPVHAAIAIFGDEVFVCPTRRAARYISEAGVRVFRYVFDHFPGWSNNCSLVEHTYELPFVFPNIARAGNYTFTSAEKQLVHVMSSYWTNFATYLDPNQNELPKWPLYNMEDGEMDLVLNVPFSYRADYRASYCDFWDQLQQD